MSEAKDQSYPLDELPTAAVQVRRLPISIVWIVPIIALFIGGWLVYKAFSEKGPTITISFESAEGLEAGKTKIRYKDVDLGKVTAIDLSDDLSQVIVTAELVKYAESFITENTRFWVVRARVAATGISGLGTLFSGAYIALDPGKKGRTARYFKGLPEPPIVTTDLPGHHVLLQALDRGSLEIGSPVYYRKIQVGQVVAHRLAKDGRMVEIEVFIETPYDQFVYENTRFWESSGFNITLDTEGVRIDTESMVSIAIGSIAFGLPPKAAPGPSATNETIFTLHKNIESAYQVVYSTKRRLLLLFHESVRGLKIGAPVELYGIQVGNIADLWLDAGPSPSDYRASVVIEVEPDRARREEDGAIDPADWRKTLDNLVEAGLRARIDSGNLLTGRKLITLDFYPEASPACINWDEPLAEFPTVPSPMANIGNRMNRIVSKIESLPLEQIGKDIREAAQGAKEITRSPETMDAIRNLNAVLLESRQLVADLRVDVAPEVEKTFEQAQVSLKTAEEMLQADSSLQVKMKSALDEIADAARSLRNLTDYLERHPEALIQGKEKD